MKIAWLSSGDLAPPAFDANLRQQGHPTDQWTEVTWTAPGHMLDVGATLQGESRESGVDTLNWHLTTHETETTCHYGDWATRNVGVNAEENVRVRGFVEHAFSQQDKPMLEAQQRRIGSAEFWSLKPVLLQVDAGAVRAARRLQALLAAEGQAA